MSYYVIAAIGLVVLWLLFGGTSGRLRVGRVVEDFEARLQPVQQEGPAWMASGKAHRERYADGRIDFDLRCRGIRTNTGTPKVPVGATLEVALGETVIARVPLRQGHVRLALSSRKGDRVPTVNAGTAISLRYEGTVLLRGTFELD